MILALTTATAHCSIALVALDGTPVAERGHDDAKNHAERLFPTIDEMFIDAGLTKRDVTRVACDVGPGSFTGVRVGLASAKGIALGLGVPLVGVGSLEAMCAAALSVAPRRRVACALLDAKRGEVFVGAYDDDGNAVLAPTHAAVGEVSRVVAGLDDALYCGHVVEKEDVTPTIIDPSCDYPSATWIGKLARDREAGELALMEPTYVRAPDAKKPN